MRQQDIDNHLRREAEERAAAAAAINPNIRRLHLDLAERHAERICQGRASPIPSDDQDREITLP